MNIKLVLFCSVFIFSRLWAEEPQNAITTYEKKKVIIIGASTGIGRELASVFIKNGYIVGALSRNTAKLQEAKELLGDNFIYATGDIQEEASMEIVKNLISQINGCDIFIMNAGIWDDARYDLHKKEIRDELNWKKLLLDQQNVITINIIGFTRMANLAFEYFSKQSHGHFVGISSVDAVRGNPCAITYSASKAFESTFMQGWRSIFEMAELPIYVTDIRPGFIATYPLGANAFWVEPLDKTGQEIFEAIQAKEKIAYITKRWEKFAHYLMTVPDATYNFLAAHFNIRCIAEDLF